MLDYIMGNLKGLIWLSQIHKMKLIVHCVNSDANWVANTAKPGRAPSKAVRFGCGRCVSKLGWYLRKSASVIQCWIHTQTRNKFCSSRQFIFALNDESL